VACPSCGAPVTPGKRFCRSCGASLPTETAGRFASPESYTPRYLAERILTSRGALEGERKQVTVLFADLKSSMEILAERDPETARKLLDPVLERMMEAVHRYEGTVNQVLGDGIMALFGAPLAHEDHAVRACYAALRMQESVTEYAEGVFRSHGVPLQIRVGLNSGEVVVRAIRSDLHMDYTAVGQTTHLAARMEQMATPGATLLTPMTFRLAEGYVQVVPRGPVTVKGLSQPVEVYALTGATTLRSRLHAAAVRGLTRFVGRDHEIAQLRRVLALAQDGHGQVVAVVGEPGVGKSRLFYELTHSIGIQDWLMLEAGSFSYGKATSYLPAIDLLKAYFKVHDRESHREIREKVTGKLLTLDRGLEPELAPLLALLDVPVEDVRWETLDPPQRRRLTIDAVKRLLLRESQRQPLLVILEDLHWIDGETAALLDSLIDSLPTSRVLLLVNYRPEHHHAWGSKSYYTQLQLDALPPESVDQLLLALLGTDTTIQPLKPVLFDRTGGNPLFLEESVRALVETGVLVGERGAYRLARPVDAIEVPATVQAILASRIDRLAFQDKELLQTAAVIGKDVPFALLLDIAGGSEEDVRRGLVHLQAAEFLYESRLFPDLEYTFKHALTHEVAYGGLLHDRRRRLHGAVVDTIESRYADRLGEQTERLAHHAVRAEAWNKAVTYLWQAGRSARARSAYRQAVGFLEQAWTILGRLPESRENTALRIDLLCRDLSDPLNVLTQYGLLVQYLHDAEVLAERADDRARLAEVLARTVLPLRLTGRHDQAVKAGEKALALAQEVGDEQLTILARVELGVAYSIGAHLRHAEPLLKAALVSLDALPAATHGQHTAWLRRRALMGLVRTLAGTGRFPEAIQRGEEALRLAEDLGHPAPIAGALERLGFAHYYRGDARRSIELYERSLTLSRDREVHDVVQRASAHLGAAHVLVGRIDDAVSYLERAVAAGESSNSVDPFALVSLGEAYLRCGRREEAHVCATRALALCREHGQRGNEAHVRWLLGELASARGRNSVAEADTHYREALAIADELGMRPLSAHCHFGIGVLGRRRGRRREASEQLVIAAEMYRQMGMTYWQEKAERQMSDLEIPARARGSRPRK
jgi:class 3 adenylate cyclase/tetratricopeptide (TPR) repeat protein